MAFAVRAIMKTTAARLSALYLLLFALCAVLLVFYITSLSARMLTAQTMETIDEEVQGLARAYQRGGLPTQISHAKVIGQANWGKSSDMLRLVEDARARGVDVTLDQYPYTASSTSIAAALLPSWVLEGGLDATLQRLHDPVSRARAKTETMALLRDERGGGDPKNVQFASCGFDPSIDGRTLADLTSAHGFEPNIENAAEAVLWVVEQGGCQGIFHAMSDEDLERILRYRGTMIASDGEVPIFGRAFPHPRSYGTSARSRSWRWRTPSGGCRLFRQRDSGWTIEGCCAPA